MGEAYESVRVLIVEDDRDIAATIARKLTSLGHHVEVAHEPRALLDRVRTDGANHWDVVLLDIGLPDINGIDVLRHLRDRATSASIVMLTGDETATTATSCLRAGAFHYITKPVRPSELAAVVESAARHARLRQRLADDDRRSVTVVGSSPAIQQLRSAIERVARHDTAVLIRGERGTGKEIVARALHEAGPRASGPFVVLDCSAIAPDLIDRELFGHAPTGYPGALAEATGGTLFVDQIGEMPLDVQARLLRALEAPADRAPAVDARVIVATHVDLAPAVAQGRFRSDLFYRLYAVVITVPPLRERLGDVPALAAHFLRKHGGASAPVLTPEALDAIANDAWPGNVRELENALMHALAFCDGDAIGIELLPSQITSRGPTLPVFDAPDEMLPLTEAKRRLNASFERSYLLRAIERAKGSVSEAARLAGIDRTNMRRLLKRHMIEPGAFRRRRAP